MITLEKPSLSHLNDFIDFIEEFKDEDHGLVPDKLIEMSKDELTKYYPQYVEKIDEDSIVMDGMVIPIERYFICKDGRVIGQIFFRHRLTPFLLKIGGHIGFKIKKSERGKNYGNEALKLMLKKVWEQGYTEVMLACNHDNASSYKTIEKCDGVLIRIDHIAVGENIRGWKREYWIFKE